jgi:hypothetical protein
MKKLFTFFLVLVSSFVLVGCAFIGDTGTSEGSDGSTGEVAPSIPEGGMGPDTSSLEITDRNIIVTASAYITAEEPKDAVDQVLALVAKQDGLIDQKNIYSDSKGEVVSAYLVVRVPVEKLDVVLESLNEVGKIETSQLSAADVTLTVRDLSARANALQVSVDRLLVLLESATKTSDLVEIESALSERQAELDSINSTLDYYQDAVAMSTLSIEIAGPSAAPAPEPETFWDAIVVGFNALSSFARSAFLAIGIALPWILAIAILGMLIVLIVRMASRTKK